MKLLFVAPSAYPLGGVAEWLDYLLPGLESHGHHCVLGLAEGKHHRVDSYLERHPGHRAVRISNPTGSAEGRIRGVVDAVRHIRPDLLAVVNIVSVYEGIRRMRAKREPAPAVVMTMHGFQRDMLDDASVNLDVLDGIVATNRLAVRMAQARMPDPQRVRYASYGVATQAAPPAPTAAMPAPFRLIYAGRLDQEQKRVLDLVSLAAILKDRQVACRITVAGSGPDEAVLKEAVSAHGLDQAFVFLGSLAPEALSLQLGKQDAMIVTSAWETGPIVAWEAMAHGLPVISSRYVGSVLEGALTDGHNCMLFPVGDMAAAASAVESLFPLAARSRLVQAGLELVRRRYSRATSVQLWNDALEAISKLSPLPPPKGIRHTPHSGRLDRYFGAAVGDRVRKLVGRSYSHAEPGGEWPHTGRGHDDRAAFLSLARSFDHD